MRGEEWRVGIEEFAMSYTAGRWVGNILFPQRPHASSSRVANMVLAYHRVLFFTVFPFLLLFVNIRFNTRSLFKLAQISGIVKFSCLQTFGSKPYAWHPTSARAYYGLRKVSGVASNWSCYHCFSLVLS